MKKEEKTMKDTLGDVINSLSESIDRTIEDNNDKSLAKVIDKYLDKTKDMCDDKNELFWMLDYQIENIKSVYLHKNTDFSRNQMTMIKLYDFISNILEKFFEKTEGMACSVDRAHYVLRKVVDYDTDKTIVIENGQWYSPKCGDIQKWQDFVYAVIMLSNGYTDKFFKEYADMLTLYQNAKEQEK